MTMEVKVLIAAGSAVLVLALMVIIWQLYRLSASMGGGKKAKTGSEVDQDNAAKAIEEVDHLFNDEFRQELRNHGRLYFEKIIGENAMFLKQDLDITIAQMNDYLNTEIRGKLNEELTAYTKAMQDSRQMTLETLQRTAQAIETERAALSEQLKQDVSQQEAVLLRAYEENMAKIVEHYILQTLGDQFDFKAQLPFIISQMEANKQKIMDDMRL